MIELKAFSRVSTVCRCVSVLDDDSIDWQMPKVRQVLCAELLLLNRLHSW